jgi:hypothetical protein
MRVLLITSALTALLAAPAGAQSGTGEFCVKTMSGEARCVYRSMAQCEQALPSGSRDQCVERSQVSGTAGAGTGSSPETPQRSKPIPPPAPPQ